MTRGFRAIVALVAALAFHGLAAAQSVKVKRAVADIRVGVGFVAGSDTVVKLGHWTPIAVTIESSGGPFTGELHLTTTDSDNLNTTIVIPNVVVPETSAVVGSQVVHGIIKFGSPDLAIETKLIEIPKEGSPIVVEEKTFQLHTANRKAKVVPPDEMLVAYFDSVGGLFDVPEAVLSGQRNLQSLKMPNMARLPAERDFPTQWFGYGGVDAFVLSTGRENFFDRLDPGRASALRTWVRQGGHLVVSAAKNWQLVDKSFLGPMVPAKITGMDELKAGGEPFARAAEALETFARGPALVASEKSGLQLAKLDAVRGHVLLRVGDRPVAVAGPYGLGRVTLLAFDTDESPFREWKAGAKFWIRLLKIPTQVEDSSIPQGFGGRITNVPLTDLASRMNQHLEEFADVTVVPFAWVAVLIFLYILLIGPLDYFFLKKVVGRLELTWITFPTWVILISVAAYFAAYALKGDDLRLNRVEIVDVDAGTGTLRGTGMVGLFSPRIARYDLAYQPSLGAGGAWGQLVAAVDPKVNAGTLGDDQMTGVTSWLAIPEHGFRGMGSEGSAGLLGRRGYQYQTSADGTALMVGGAPVQVWSVKTFMGRWLAKAGAVVDHELRWNGTHLKGTVTNQLSVPLENAMLIHVDKVFAIPRISAKGTFDLSAVVGSDRRFLADLLAHEGPDRSTNREGKVNLDQLIRGMLFSQKKQEGNRTGLPNRQLSFLDLSAQLEFGKAILLAKVDADGGQLWLNDPPAAGKTPKPLGAKIDRHTYLRVLLEPAKEIE